MHLVPEHLNDLLGLALSKEAVVHVDRHQPVADGLDEERRHHGGIHAAGQGQQHLAVAHLRPDGGHLFVDIRLRQFRRVDPLHVLGTDQKLLHTLPPIFDNIT